MYNFCNIEINGNGNNIGQFILVGPASKALRKIDEQPCEKNGLKSLNNLPDLNQEIVITDHQYQEYLVTLIRHLIENGVASLSGKYIKGAARTPVFRDKEKEGIEVISIDKKTGQRLLKGQYLSRPDSINKLLKWVVEKFSIVHEMAETAYDKELDKDEQRAHIIVGAALFIDSLSQPSSKNNG